jgi:hypothetical protein
VHIGFGARGSQGRARPAYTVVGGGGAPPPYFGTVGQGVEAYAYSDDGTTLSNCTFYGLPSNIVANYIVTSSSAYVIPSGTSTANDYIDFYFPSAAEGSMYASCEYDGSPVDTAAVSYSVTAPAFSAVASYGKATLDTSYSKYPGYEYFHWGNPIAGQTAIAWNYSVSGAPSGQIEMVQLIEGSSQYYMSDGTTATGLNIGSYLVDNSAPYDPAVNTPQTWSSDDSPGFPSIPPASSYSGTGWTESFSFGEYFVDYFMYQPSGGIWVSLGSMNWGWSGSASDVSEVCTQDDGVSPIRDGGVPITRPTPVRHCSVKQAPWVIQSGPSLSEQSSASAGTSLPTWSGVYVNQLRRRP